MSTPDPRIEIVGQPEPLTGVTEFHCRCGMTLSTADFPRFAAYEKARKDHRDACPMRFDKPWPFDRLPSLRRTKTPSETGPNKVGESVSEGSDADPTGATPPRSGRQAAALERAAATHSRRLLRWLFPSAPGWVVRRCEVGL